MAKNLLFLIAVLSIPFWLIGLIFGFIALPFYNGFVIGFTTLRFQQEKKIRQYAEEIVNEETEKLKQQYKQETKNGN